MTEKEAAALPVKAAARDQYGHFLKKDADPNAVPTPPKRDSHGHFLRTNFWKGPGQSKNLPEPAKIAPVPTIQPAPPGTKKLVQAEILELRDILVQDRAKLARIVENLHGSALALADGINLEEDGTELTSQLFGLRSASDVEERIRQIDEALRAIDAGTYGYCTICGNLINPKRLRALPSAKTCIRCQSAAENQVNGRIFVQGRI